MSLKRQIRFLTGGAAVLTLLGLVAAETIIDGVTLTLENKLLLISLISTLLSVDIALDQLPIDFGALVTTQGREGDDE